MLPNGFLALSPVFLRRFLIAAPSLAVPADAVEDVDFHRTSTFIPEEESGEQPATPTNAELSPLEPTMPFTFADGSQEDFEIDIPEPQDVIEHSPEYPDDDSVNDSSPEE